MRVDFVPFVFSTVLFEISILAENGANRPYWCVLQATLSQLLFVFAVSTKACHYGPGEFNFFFFFTFKLKKPKMNSDLWTLISWELLTSQEEI